MVKFEAVRKVCVKEGEVVLPGKQGTAPKEIVEQWLETGAVKLVMEDEKATRPRRNKDADSASD